MSNPKHRIKIYTPDSHILIGVLIITENDHRYLEFKRTKSSDKEAVPLDVLMLLFTLPPELLNTVDNFDLEKFSA